MEVVLVVSGARRLELSGDTFLEAGSRFARRATPRCEGSPRFVSYAAKTEIERRAAQYAFNGSSTENALVQMAFQSRIDPIAVRLQYPLPG
jgi:hypothetical protein